MQTFLPYKDFQKTVECLDYKRLGKQRVETMQIMNVLCGLSSGWANHPAVLMWENYEEKLLEYQFVTIAEWTARGYKDNVCLDKTIAAFECLNGPFKEPWWLGNHNLHQSHQSNLLRKNFEHYSQFGWSVRNDIEYWWPTKEVPECPIKMLATATFQ